MKELDKFPKWKYHEKVIDGKVFHSAIEFENYKKKEGLISGWVDSPADFNKIESVEKIKNDKSVHSGLSNEELREILVSKYGYNKTRISKSNKEDLISLVEAEEGKTK
jgi:hypothetical protein